MSEWVTGRTSTRSANIFAVNYSGKSNLQDARTFRHLQYEQFGTGHCHEVQTLEIDKAAESTLCNFDYMYIDM